MTDKERIGINPPPANAKRNTGNTSSPLNPPPGPSDGLSPLVRPLLRNNFIIMAVSCVLIVLGFVLMAGSSTGPNGFNPDIFSTRRIVVGPLISFLGYVLMGIAIIAKPKE